MVQELVGVDDLISAMKKMAVHRGLEEGELRDYLDTYAFRYGAVALLKNLAGASLRVRTSVSTLDYMFTKRLAIDILAKEFNPGEKILSIGCGTGLLEANLARLGCRVWGLDKKKDLVDIAKSLAIEEGLSDNCKFRRVDGYRYPFSTGFFDAALYSHSLHEIDGKTATLRGVRRVLNNQGRVVILEGKSDLREMDLKKVMKSASFKLNERRIPVPAKGKNSLVQEVHLVILMKE